MGEFGRSQLAELRRGITDLIEAIEVGGVPHLDPHERLDLWQYLHAVRSRLVLVDHALARDDPGMPQADDHPVEESGNTAACG